MGLSTLILTAGTCIPGDESYCSFKGYCMRDGHTCKCYDPDHYYPADLCKHYIPKTESPSAAPAFDPSTLNLVSSSSTPIDTTVYISMGSILLGTVCCICCALGINRIVQSAQKKLKSSVRLSALPTLGEVYRQPLTLKELGNPQREREKPLTLKQLGPYVQPKTQENHRITWYDIGRTSIP